MSSYLITGATGFIGKRLVRSLTSQNHKVTLVSRELITDFDSVIFDFETDNLSKIDLNGIDIIFHLAGIAHDLNNNHNDLDLYRKINVTSVVTLAELALKAGVKKFIFVSSVKAGGQKLDSSVSSEVHQGVPEGLYGQTKREAELKLLDLALNSKMFISIVRPALVYGPDLKGNLKLMLEAIEKGWFPPLPRVKNRRSMVHVDDVVDALKMVSLDSRANGEIFIVTDGKTYTSREIFDAMCYVLGKPIPAWSVPYFMFSLAAFFSSNMKQKIFKLLGDEYYSSEKIQSIGFKAKRSLREMNETFF